jgi:hypothetical protein
MATWAEFAAGRAEIQVPTVAGKPATWQPFDGGGAALAAAGERLLFGSTDVALLGTVTPSGRPRIHPFIPRIVEGRLWAFVVQASPKRRDLERHGQYTIHASLAPEDEEFWVAGRARRHDDPALRETVRAAMPYAVHDWEALFEFDLEIAGWTRWLDFGTPMHRPVYHRWTA